jgi:hypothetical protein
VFGFVDRHAGGTITIENFNSTDNLAFGGYGYSLASPPTETIVDGNDVMTLSDGTLLLCENRSSQWQHVNSEQLQPGSAIHGSSGTAAPCRPR